MANRRFDAVVIGGGAVGASTAYHLADRGVSVALIERDRIASGSTGRAAGGIRTQFSSELVTRLMVESTDLFEAFEARTDRFSFERIGYLFLGRTPEQGGTLANNVEMHRECGVDARLLAPTEVEELVPSLRTDDLNRAAYCPTDGFSDPHAVATWLADEAREKGAAVHENTEVIDILVENGAVTGVETSEGAITCDAVVNAAGVWAPRLAELVDVSLAVEPRRIQIAVMDVGDAVSRRDPMVVDLDARTYFRPEGEDSLLVGGHNPADDGPADPDAYGSSHDFAFVEHVTDVLVRRVPDLTDARVTNGWAGLKGATPDGEPVVGPCGPNGFYVASGFNGHGFMLSPVLGRALAGHVATGDWPGLGLGPLSPDRFADGSAHDEGEFML